MRFVGVDALKPLHSALVVNLTLAFLFLLEFTLMHVEAGGVLLAPLLDLVCELRVLLGDSDLLLQSLLFVVKLTEAIFEHLSLNVRQKAECRAD